MSANASTINVTRNVRVKAIALPVEHGSWGFVFEPLVAAIAVAPSLGSVWIALLVIGSFLARQPLKVLLTDWQAKRNLPQTRVALKFTFFYGAFALLGLLGSLYIVNIYSFLPVAFILPLAGYQIYCDASRKSRQLLPELTGAIAISSSAAVIALAGGWTLPAALALWTIFAARLIPSILYVRNRLRLEKGKDFSRNAVIFSNLAAVAVAAVLAADGLIPKLPVIMFAVLAARAILGISPYRKKVKAMKIGVWEVIYGVLTVLSVIIGYIFHI